MSRQVIFTEEALPPLPIYSQAIVSNGTVYASGNIGITRDMKLVEGGVQGQTRAALKNLEIVLKASGSSLANVLKVNIYLTNLKRDFAPMNETYSEFPARTCIGVAELPLGADVEIECIAAVA
ncbi:YjgF-like protein [Vararia minispora EC-137]|uniref:YjgF-like protein n=1 Tax=Vararia minispora EC-137 TaxID=1314806 RepID=A0ACB8QE05_9AGAM|nr:YjgF-like protein [Vararia minispora EC-137]